MHNSPVNETPRMAATDEPFAIYHGRVISRGQLWADVAALARQLPEQPYLFNLCENRYLFCICLLAAAARKQTCLLPPSNQSAVIEEIRQTYPAAYLASDKNLPGNLEYIDIQAASLPPSSAAVELDWDRPAVIAFTSGSTGHPKPCAHSLRTFAVSARMAIGALGLSGQCRVMISTTPPQHMYGLETSVFWPLFSSLVLYDGRPFFPEDIRLAVATAPRPAILASTPTHLRSMVGAEGDWPNLTGILSATDTLPSTLANEMAAILGQSPREIYGSTETLSFASREILQDPLWRPYPGSRLTQDHAGQVWLASPHLPNSITLQDAIRIHQDGRFEALGRHDDMIKVGGKRISLSELNRRLKAIEGVEDGFCFLQQHDHGARLAAVVVSHLNGQDIRRSMKATVDEVFMPRKIHFVDHIPRNEAGKLSKSARESLLAVLNACN